MAAPSGELVDDPLPLAAAGRPGFKAVFWPADGKIGMVHWGPHTSEIPGFALLPCDRSVPITARTRLAAAAIPDTYDGVYWAGDSVIHHIYHRSEDWTVFKYQAMEAPGVVASTPLAACGRKGYAVIFWAGEGQIHFRALARSTGWTWVAGVIPLELPVSPGKQLYGLCGGNAEDQSEGTHGVVWTQMGKIHHVYEDFRAWNHWRYETYVWPAGRLTGNKPIAACGRCGYGQVFSALNGQLAHLHWGAWSGWKPVPLKLPDFALSIKAHTRLYALCGEDEFDAVVWVEHLRVPNLHLVWKERKNWTLWRHRSHPIDGVAVEHDNQLQTYSFVLQDKGILTAEGPADVGLESHPWLVSAITLGMPMLGFLRQQLLRQRRKLTGVNAKAL